MTIVSMAALAATIDEPGTFQFPDQLAYLRRHPVTVPKWYQTTGAESRQFVTKCLPGVGELHVVRVFLGSTRVIEAEPDVFPA